MGCSVSATSQKQQGGGRGSEAHGPPGTGTVPKPLSSQTGPGSRRNLTFSRAEVGEAQPEPSAERRAPGPDTGLKTWQQSHFHEADHVLGPAPAPEPEPRPGHCCTSRGPGATPC